MGKYTAIDDPSAYFQIALHSSANAATITNDGNSDLQPDFIWSKARGAAYNHGLYDSTRGVTKFLSSNASSAETTASSGFDLTSFNTDGFSTGNNQFNTICGGTTYVAWQWKANGGTTSSNTDGTITSTVQANTDAGFSIITYTGTGGGETFGHGLGVAPDMWIVKRRSGTGSWAVGFNDANILGGTSKYLILQGTGATSTYNNFWGSSPASSTVMRIAGDVTIGGSGSTYVAYAFAEKQGYSKFGKYTGNGNANGPFVYTGFKPAWIMVKNIDSGIDHWHIIDNKRSPNNVVGELLFADLTSAEITYTTEVLFDIVSNGFKLRGNYDHINKSGENIIYMAFAENPFTTSTGVPCTAR